MAGSSKPTTRWKWAPASAKSPEARRSPPRSSSVRATSRVSGPGRFGSGPGVGGRASSIGRTILDWPDVRTVHPAAAGIGAGRDLRGRAARRRSRWPLQRRPDRRCPRRRAAGRAARADRLSLGPHPALGDRGPGRLEDDQRSGRDDHLEPGLPRRVRPQALPRPRRFVLRVEARRHGPAAVPDRPARRPAARACRAVGRLEGPGGRRRPAHLHDRDDHAERGDRGSARSDAGHRRGGRLGPLAGPGARRPWRAARAAGAVRGGRPRRVRRRPGRQ